MKKLFLISACTFSLLAAQQEPDQQPQALFTHSIDKQLSSLGTEKDTLVKAQTQTRDTIKNLENLKKIKSGIEAKQPTERTFCTKILSIIMQDQLVLSETEQVQNQTSSFISEHTKLLKEFKDDPEFKKLSVSVKTTYSFDEFEELGRRLLSTKNKLQELEKTRSAALYNLRKREKELASLESEYKEKVKQQEEAFQASNNSLTKTQQGELLDAHQQLFTDKKALATAKINESNQHIILIDTRIMILRAQQAILKENYDRVKKALYVDKAYVQKTESDLDRKRTTSALERDRLHSEIKELIETKEALQEKLAEQAKRFKLTTNDLMAMADWSKTPISVQEWNELCTLGSGALEEALLATEQEYKEALINLEKAKVRKEEIQYNIIKSWHMVSERKLGFRSSTIEQHLKLYETPKIEIQNDLAALIEKRSHAITQLQELNNILERIKKTATRLQEKRLELNQNHGSYSPCYQKILKAEDQTHDRIYLTAKLIEVYSNAIALLEETTKRIENVATELGAQNFWRRSDQAISYQDFKNFWPDIQRFLYDITLGIKAYWKTLTPTRMIKSWQDWATKPSHIILFLLRLLIIILLYFILRAYLPELRAQCTKKQGFFAKSLARQFLAVVVGFFNQYLFSLYTWTIIYLLVHYEVITNFYFTLLFYLLSIPYLLYIAHSFIRYLLLENERQNYLFISKEYRPRFAIFVPLLTYLFIILLFFKKAFSIADYQGSAVPNIIIMILELCVVLLISKQLILSFIPRKNPLLELLADVVNNYFYVLRIAFIVIIIMSNLGYGHQVLYIISRIFIIALLIPIIMYMYSYIRRMSADLFFYYNEGDTIIERFGSARAWYGFFVVISFAVFVFLTLLLGLKIIGYSITLGDIGHWFTYELYSPGLDEIGRRLSVTPLTFLKFVLILIIGVLSAHVINRILLRRIFDPLLISSGVQNTIFTFTRYFLIFVTLLIGMKSVGLESFATKFFLVLGAIGFAVKDPILDFFSYFIILVQRPIKIGDLIMFDENVSGVVRHITPRSVIIRKENSVTIIIPNSHVITKPFKNWTFSPTFLGLDNIYITIPYNYDPERIKLIIARVLDMNPHILKTPTPVIRLDDFAPDGFQFLVRGYITADKVLDRSEIASQIRFDLIRTFKVEKIEIAYPTRFVKMDELPPSKKQ